MRHVAHALAAIAAAGSILLLGACSDDSVADSPPSSPTSPSSSAEPTAVPKPPPFGPAGDRPPLGLEVRYVDEHGRFATVSPQDFPR